MLRNEIAVEQSPVLAYVMRLKGFGTAGMSGTEMWEERRRRGFDCNFKWEVHSVEEAQARTITGKPLNDKWLLAGDTEQMAVI